jgi:CRISPR-associated protein Cas1
MAWKGVHVSRPSRLSWKDAQLVVAQDEGQVTMPLEDVAWIVLDSNHSTLTASLVSACMDLGVVIVFSDQRHTPSGLALPFHRHHRQAAVAGVQMALTQPLKKRLWQALVVAKIENQAACLAARGKAGGSVAAMARLVASGDPDNVEARAARDYWSLLFEDFSRGDEGDLRNKMLNYGYAVVRAAVARALVANGLLPCLGLHHDSAANAFNLADDLFEPFRPIVDAKVAELTRPSPQRGEDRPRSGQVRGVNGSNEALPSPGAFRLRAPRYGGQAGACPLPTGERDGELTVDHRRELAALLNADVSLGEETVSVLIATERASESLVRAMEGNSPALLSLPRL